MIDDYDGEEDATYDDFGDDFDDDFDDACSDDYGIPSPKRKKKSKASKLKEAVHSKKTSAGGGLPPMTFNINRINIAFLVVGCVLLFQGCRETISNA